MTKPGLTLRRFRMVRMNSPAPTMSSRLKLICNATQVRRNFNAPPEPVPLCCLRDSTRRGFQNCKAGATLNSRLASKCGSHGEEQDAPIEGGRES